MKLNLNEVSATLKAQIEKSVNALKDGQCIIITVENGKIADSFIGTKWLDLARMLRTAKKGDFILKMEDGSEYVKNTPKNKEFEKALEKSHFQFYWNFEKHNGRADAERTTRDEISVLVRVGYDLANLKKGDKYTEEEIQEMLSSDDILKEYAELIQKRDAIIKSRKFNTVEANQCFDRIEEIEDQNLVNTRTQEIEKLKGTQKPSNYSEEEREALKSKFGEILDIVLNIKANRNNEKFTNLGELQQEVRKILENNKGVKTEE